MSTPDESLQSPPPLPRLHRQQCDLTHPLRNNEGARSTRVLGTSQLWIIPLIVAGLMVWLPFRFTFGNMQFDDKGRTSHAGKTGSAPSTLMIGRRPCRVPGDGICSPVLLMDCLYTERKDRSILFWEVSAGIGCHEVHLQAASAWCRAAGLIPRHGRCVLFQVIWAIRVASGSLPISRSPGTPLPGWKVQD